MWCPRSGKNCQVTGCTTSYQMCQRPSLLHPEHFTDAKLTTDHINDLERQIKELQEENAKLRAHIQNINAAGSTEYYY